MRQPLRVLAAFAVATAFSAAGLHPASADDTYVPPHFAKQVKPTYPDSARAAHETGQVAVKILVDATGRPKSFTIFKSSGFKDLDNAVLAAVKASTYKPATRGGTPVVAFYDVSYKFTLTGLAADEVASGDMTSRLAKDPGNTKLRLNVATILINQKKYDQAETVLADGTRRAPNNAAMWERLGIAYFDDGLESKNDLKYKEASDAFDKSLAIDPKASGAQTAWAAYSAWSVALLTQGQVAASLPYAQKAVNGNPNSAAYHYLLAKIQENLGQGAAALAEYNKAASLDDKKKADFTANIYVGMAQADFLMGNETAAIAAINQAEKIDASSSQPYQALANYYIRKGNYGAALSPLFQLAQLKPNDASVQVQIGTVYVRNKQYDKAKVAFDRAVSLDPKSPEAVFGQAQLYAVQGDVGNADAALQRALALDPKRTAEFNTILAQIYEQPVARGAADHLKEAVRYANAATAANPNYALAWYALGVAYADQSKSNDAAAALVKAYALFKAGGDSNGMQNAADAYKQITHNDIPNK